MHLTRRVARASGRLFGFVPGWYMILVEPLARRTAGVVTAASLHGTAMEFDLSEFVQRKHFFHSYERREIRFLRRIINDGDTCVDIGANVGVLSTEMAAAVGPQGHVIAVEPVPTNLERLRTNASLQHHGVISVVAAAVGEASGGVLVLRLTRQQRAVGNMGSYTAGDPSNTEMDSDEIEVPVRSLDDILATDVSGVSSVRVLKIDVEGMETEVLLGARNSLAANRIDVVMFEQNHAVGGGRPEQVLTELGFVVHELSVGARLRRIRTIPEPRSTTTIKPGLIPSTFAWLRGDARLRTLVATRPGL
jgi:FkbM family methyltransferase